MQESHDRTSSPSSSYLSFEDRSISKRPLRTHFFAPIGSTGNKQQAGHSENTRNTRFQTYRFVIFRVLDYFISVVTFLLQIALQHTASTIGMLYQSTFKI